jgi:hypothetical protein
LEEKVKTPCATAGEWFSELLIVVHEIQRTETLSKYFDNELEVILKILKSIEPYSF